MTTDAIISALYQSKELDDCIAKVVRPDHVDDFKQELFIIIYEMPPYKIQQLHELSALKFYVVRVILNLAKQQRNIYHKKYLDSKITYSSELVALHNEPEQVNEDRQVTEAKELMLLDKFSNLDNTLGSPYYKALVELIVKHGSQRAVSRLTGIEPTSICKAVKRVRNHLLAN